MMLVPTRKGMIRTFDDAFRLPDIWDEDPFLQLRGMAADVYETAKDVVVKMAVPGVKREDISISIVGGTLYVSGETKEEEKTEKKDYYQKEMRYGSFSQAVNLPNTILSDKAEAVFKDGVLKVTLPKSPESQPKKIEIKSAGKK